MKSIKPEEYVHLLELYLSKLFSKFGERVISVVLYGSLARGAAHKTSDIDLLVVLDKVMGARFKEISEVEDEELSKAVLGLWREKGVCPSFQPYVLSAEEARYHRSLYLDLVQDAVILYDRDSFMTKILKEVKNRLDELKAKRVMLPDGTWYWILKPKVARGEIIEI